MNREIKFRFWQSQDKKMTIQGNASDENRSVFWEKWETTSHVSEPMQFTGLKDKNGKEIFEGDILENPVYDKNEWERCEVKYYDEYARFGLEFYSPYGGEGYTGREQHIDRFVSECGCYVIGNIFENEDLLTK